MANIDEMKQEAADKKKRKALDDAYMGSLTSTMPAPKKPAMPKQQTQMSDDDESAYKRGGKVGSASKRADGIASKGKTRGTMIMCGGGKM